jgi:hypothetical protein
MAFFEYGKEETIKYFEINNEVLEDVFFVFIDSLCEDRRGQMRLINYLTDNKIIEYENSEVEHISPFYTGFKLKFRLNKVYLRKQKLKKL